MRVGTMAGVNHCLQLVLLVSWLILHGATPTQSHNHGGHASGHDWLKYNGGMYKVGDYKKNWAEAWDDCKRNEAYLVIINTEDENHFIKTNSLKNKRYWIGLQVNPGAAEKNHSDKFWWWQKNEGFTDWVGGTGDCVEITKFGWNDNTCTKTSGYWCEKETDDEVDGWIYFRFHKYQVFNETKSWNDAWDDCKKKKSYLVIIDTEDENQFIKENSQAGKAYWIGLHANPGVSGQHKDKYWWWHNHEGFFEDWAKNNPDNPRGAEDCVEIYVGQGWNNNNCSKTFGYWCERETDDQGNGWLKFNVSMYKKVADKKNWTEAWDDCKRNESYLAIINTEDENEFIKNNSLMGNHYWIGLQFNPGASAKAYKDKFWCWQKNEGFADWGGITGDCVEITKSGWNDIACTTETSGYWCESETDDNVDGWIDFNGHKYRVFNATKTWNEAWDECKRKKSYLVIINSEEENKFIKEKSQAGKAYWIGLHANPGAPGHHEGKFGWWQKHDKVFTDWATANPDDAGRVEDCVEISNLGWNDNKCNEIYRYWCEKKETVTGTDCDSLSTLEGASLCLPIGHGDKDKCQAIPGCCFIEAVEVEKFNTSLQAENSFGMCIKPNGA